MTTASIMRRLERVKARRQPHGVLIVPPHSFDDAPPTEAERADLIRQLEAGRDNVNLIVVIRPGPRLDSWNIPPELLPSGGAAIRWHGLPAD